MTGVRQVDVGNIIHPTDPNGLVVVTQLQPISVIFSLPEDNLPKIQQQMASGPLTVIAYSQDDRIKLDDGKLEPDRQRDSCRRPAPSGSRPSFPIRRISFGRAN